MRSSFNLCWTLLCSPVLTAHNTILVGHVNMEKDPLLIQYTLRLLYPPALQVHEIIGEDTEGITG